MNHSGNWQLDPGKASPETVEPSNVQAWARDTKTGEPVYILELGKDRVGKRCGCECQSCNLALIAVNAAKSEYKKAAFPSLYWCGKGRVQVSGHPFGRT
jgi:hypothetical protein